MDKQHAVINYDQDRDEHWVKDLGSLNGVSAVGSAPLFWLSNSHLAPPPSPGPASNSGPDLPTASRLGRKPPSASEARRAALLAGIPSTGKIGPLRWAGEALSWERVPKMEGAVLGALSGCGTV